jgi:hypothetical protein
MRKKLTLATALLGILLALPAAAQIQYFGYVGVGDDDSSLGLAKDFANFAYLSTSANLADTFVLNRVNALSQKGFKATIDLGLVLWCDYDGSGSYRQLCWDWTQRWTTWKQNNASILTSDKVLAFDILDEPFARGAYMTDFEAATQRVKADFPWAKIFMVEAACVITGTCRDIPALTYYAGSLPGIDWLGLDAYGIHPQTDSDFANARAIMKSRFPGRKWLYVLDGYWDSVDHPYFRVDDMGGIADEWYDVASSDPDAVLLGVFLWPSSVDRTGSRDFPCRALVHQVAIGRAITHKVRPQTALPIGSFSVDSSGISGWVCDPDGALCETPQIDIYQDGSLYRSSTTSYLYNAQDSIWMPQCSNGTAYRFTGGLNVGASGHRFTVVARDLDSGSTALPSTCAENPACIWYTQFYAPKGYLDNVSSTGYASGWVCDQDSPPTSSQVRILAGGTTVGVYTTNLANEQAVTTQCGGGTLHRFGVQLPASARGLQVTAYAENLGSPVGSQDVKLTVLCSNGYCIWR